MFTFKREHRCGLFAKRHDLLPRCPYPGYIERKKNEPLLIRYIDGSLKDGGPQRPSACVILWDTAIHGPVPSRIEPPIPMGHRRMKTPDEFLLLPLGAAALSFRRGDWLGAIVIQAGTTSAGLQHSNQRKHPGEAGR